MSKKPKKTKRTDDRADDAVPVEILAEGSGPNEVIDANTQTLVEAAETLVEKRKERKAGKRRQEAELGADDDAPADDTPAEELLGETTDGGMEDDAAEASGSSEPSSEASADGEVEATDTSVTRKKGKRGKRSAADAAREAEVDDVTGDTPIVAAAAAGDGADAAEAQPAASKSKKVRGKKAVRTRDDDSPEATAAAVTSDEADSDVEETAVLAFDASADSVPPEDVEASSEGEAVAAVEEAVMRAEAEAELGAAEPMADEDDPEGIELNAALPTTAATMDDGQLKKLVEALVFAADKPLTVQRLRQLTRVGDVARLERALADIATDYQERGIALQVVSGGYQFRTNTAYSVWVQQLIAGRPVRLSRAQLETLAIVAYRQPITRPEIDDIRGVDSSATLRLLLDRSLIRTLGKKEDVGRPMLYGTTKEFLDFFSLNDLRELPTLREYSELTAESRKVMSDQLGIPEDGEPSPELRELDLSDEDGEADASVAPAEPTADDLLAEFVADESISAESASLTETSVKPRGPMVDAWGQPIASDEELEASESPASMAVAIDADAEEAGATDSSSELAVDAATDTSSDMSADGAMTADTSVMADEQNIHEAPARGEEASASDEAVLSAADEASASDDAALSAADEVSTSDEAAASDEAAISEEALSAFEEAAAASDEALSDERLLADDGLSTLAIPGETAEATDDGELPVSGEPGEPSAAVDESAAGLAVVSAESSLATESILGDGEEPVHASQSINLVSTSSEDVSESTEALDEGRSGEPLSVTAADNEQVESAEPAAAEALVGASGSGASEASEASLDVAEAASGDTPAEELGFVRGASTEEVVGASSPTDDERARAPDGGLTAAEAEADAESAPVVDPVVIEAAESLDASDEPPAE